MIHGSVLQRPMPMQAHITITETIMQVIIMASITGSMQEAVITMEVEIIQGPLPMVRDLLEATPMDIPEMEELNHSPDLLQL